MIRDHYIYALIDPRDRTRRYIGFTKDIAQRKASHFYALDSDSPRVEWILDLRLGGVFPRIMILEQVTFADRRTAERRWIEKYKSRGYTMLNDLGPKGPNWSTFEARKQRIREKKENLRLLMKRSRKLP